MILLYWKLILIHFKAHFERIRIKICIGYKINAKFRRQIELVFENCFSIRSVKTDFTVQNETSSVTKKKYR